MLNLVQAINHALMEEMRRDDRVVVLGEDVGINGGVFRATEGLYKEFGEERVMDTPLSESGIIGTAIGMALYGLRPVAEIQFLDFIYPAFDQIVSELAKYRYRSAGQYTAPVVVRTPYGGGVKGGHYHSQSTETFFVHTPGLKVAIPSNPYDAKGLLKAAIRNPDPVIFMEPKKIYRTIKGEVPEEDYVVPLGTAKVAREGDDVTVFAYGTMLHVALEAAENATQSGLSVQVVDIRTLMPLDLDTVLSSAKKTGRVVILHEACRTCGYGAELAAILAEKALLNLEAPVMRVTGLDTPFPYALEEQYMPTAKLVSNAIERVARF